MSDRIESLLSRMTVRQKVGQLNQEILDFKRLDEIKEKINAEKASGNAFVSPKDTEEFQKMSVKASQLAGNIDVSKRRLAELNAK